MVKVRRRPWSERTAWVALAVALVLTMVAPALAAPVAVGADLEIGQFNTFPYPQGSVVATVPAMLSGQPVPASSFRVYADGAPVRLTGVQQLRLDQQLAIILVLDQATSAAALAEEKTAAVEFVSSLTPGARVSTGQSATQTGAYQTRQQAVDLLSRLAPTPSRTLTSQLTFAVAPTVSDYSPLTRISIVAITPCQAPVNGASLAASSTALWVIGLSGRCDPELVRIAQSTGGGAVSAAGGHLVSAGDEVRRALEGQYRLSFTLRDEEPKQVRVTLDAGGMRRNAVLTLQQQGVVGSTGRAGRPWLTFVLLGLAAALAGLGILGGLGRRR